MVTWKSRIFRNDSLWLLTQIFLKFIHVGFYWIFVVTRVGVMLAVIYSWVSKRTKQYLPMKVNLANRPHLVVSVVPKWVLSLLRTNFLQFIFLFYLLLILNKKLLKVLQTTLRTRVDCEILWSLKLSIAKVILRNTSILLGKFTSYAFKILRHFPLMSIQQTLSKPIVCTSWFHHFVKFCALEI